MIARAIVPRCPPLRYNSHLVRITQRPGLLWTHPTRPPLPLISIHPSSHTDHRNPPNAVSMTGSPQTTLGPMALRSPSDRQSDRTEVPALSIQISPRPNHSETGTSLDTPNQTTTPTHLDTFFVSLRPLQPTKGDVDDRKPSNHSRTHGTKVTE